MPQYERGGIWYDVPLPILLKLTIRGALLNALAYTNGNAQAAAKALGITPAVMRTLMDTYWIGRPKTGKPGSGGRAKGGVRVPRTALGDSPRSRRVK